MLHRLTTSTALTWVIVLFVLPLPFLFALRSGIDPLYASMVGSIGLGVTAYVWMLTAVYLAGRPRWIDRRVGLPHMYMIHGILSLLAICFAYVHKTLLPSTGLTKLLGSTGLYLFIGLAVYSLVFMAGWLSQRVRLIATIKAWLENVFRHELSIWLHRLNLVAVVIIFFHVQSIDFITANTGFMVLFDAATAAVLLWYLIGKLRQRTNAYQAVVAQVRPTAERTTEVTLALERPARVAWNPGDFTFIRFPDVPGLHEYHPFSMIDDPRSSARSGRSVMTFDIRADGDFTRRVAALQPSTQARILPPFGRYHHFVREHPDNVPLVMLAGGIGVTPLYSLLCSYADTGRPILFLYGARNASQLLYAQDIERLGAQHPKVDVELRAGGRFGTDEVQTTLGHQALYLIAGPYAMQRSWRRYLLGHGVDADDIYYEPFSM